MNSSENANERGGRSRQKVRRNVCPTCGAAPGEPCIGSKGVARVSNHKARILSSTSAIYIETYFETQTVPETSGFVVYAISHPVTLQFVYVGQTGHFTRRVRAHLRRASKYSRNPPIREWLFEQIHAGHDPVFTILESCDNEEQSLIGETKWVANLAAAGHPLLNNWRIHKSIIKLGRNAD